MSVAPDVAPEVTIPARARRTSPAWWPENTVSGNVITPSAFHRPLAGQDGDSAAVAPVRPLQLVASAFGVESPTSPAGGRPAPVLKVTARGRLAMALVALALSLAVAGAAWSSWPSSAAHPAPSAVPAQVVVRDGDTLWSIASVIAPSRDPRQTVDRLRRVNGLSSVVLVPGQILRTR